MLYFLLSIALVFQFPPLFSSAELLPHPPPLSPLPSDALALLTFKSKSDLDNKLGFSLRNPDHCHWQGVKCVQGKVVRLLLQGFGLRGIFEPNTLSRLDQLRVLSLRNNSLTGPIPDLSGLINLRTLVLDHNFFTGYCPPTISSLHRLLILDLSYNNLTGPIPDGLTRLDRIYYIQLERNRFNGSVPSFNQSFLQIFNVSVNNLTGAVPVTLTLSRFDISSFSWNPGLCGEIIHKECGSQLPFFEPSEAAAPPVEEQNQQLQGIVLPPPSPKKHKKTPLILGFSVTILLLIGSLVSLLVAIKKRRKQRVSMPPTAGSDAVISTVEEKELEAKVKRTTKVVKSGSLVFCGAGGDAQPQIYTLEQLMKGSAEMLGRGSMGTTYKAVLDNQLVVTVKRLDACKTTITSKEMFQRHIESIGTLRHPNLVPLRAFFQAKGERLLIYDYQSNGSLFSLIHGSKSARAKPLHWTSCLKIAEDVALGIAYIHQGSNLVHGNLKSSNVLLGDDFEACLTDYCLTLFVDSSFDWGTDSAGYRAPETTTSKSSSHLSTSKSDVYAFGILVIELLTSKPPSQHPLLMPMDLLNWVRDTREEEGGNDNWLPRLVELAATCSQTSPEQRPTMWQVLRMIQEIKETVMKELDSSGVFS